ncbi:amino acid/polyamine transporter I [Cladochytrium replicatum]|nr:amino acid/polyamine transporter I [Cladochytrium replicatum]
MDTVKSLFRPKPIGDWLVNGADLGHGHGSGDYKKSLSALDLVFMGVGAIIGAGIFTLTGEAAKTITGPAVTVSYVIAGVICAFAALNYAELASMIPISGSAYTYTYATLGELVAWLIGWDLMLEYIVGAASVAVGWAFYVEYFLHEASGGTITFDPKLVNAPVIWVEKTQSFEVTGNYFNLPAFIGVIALTIILSTGIRMSSIVVNVFVVIKVIVVLMFIFGGIKFTNPANYEPFAPYGATGIFRGAIIVFFAYIGFDAVSTTAQEARNPQRDLPIGIIGSLLVCTALYIGTCLVLTALLPYNLISERASVASAIVAAGGPTWFGIVLALGALAGLTSVMMVTLLGQPRIFRAMANDGLFPEIFAKISPKTQVPVFTTVFSGTICAIMAAVLPIDVLANLTSVGTLFAFLCVSIAVPILRYTQPDRERGFRIPFGVIGGYVFPAISIALILTVLIIGGTAATVVRVLVWLGIGLVVYFMYGFWWSKLRHPEKWGLNDVVQGAPEGFVEKK